MIFFRKILLIAPLIVSFFIFPKISYSNPPICQISTQKIADIFIEVKNNLKSVKNLNQCQKNNKTLFSILINKIDPHYIKYADISLRSTSSFFLKFLPLDYKIMQYASASLKEDRRFIIDAVRSNVRILDYINPKLLNDKEFAKKLININSSCYFYLSHKLQKDHNLIEMALKYNPTIFPNIPKKIRSNNKIIKQALISHPYNFNLLNKDDKKKKIVQELKISYDPDEILFFKKYLKDQYANSEIGISALKGYKITNQAKNFLDNRIFYQKYPIQWQKYNFIKNEIRYKLVINNKLQNNWEKKFDKYPKLADKIKEFLSKKIDDSAITSLNPISIWQISDKELAFNLYSIRKIIDERVNEEIINVNSLTAIAILGNDGNWQLDIVDAIYDRNIKTSPSYKKGHKRFYIWDLYKKDNDLAIIFKIEDEYSEYFEIYQKTKSDNYRQFYRLGGYYEHIIIDPNSE